MKALILLFFTPNGFFLGLSLLVGNLVATGKLPPWPVMARYAAKFGLGVVLYVAVKSLQNEIYEKLFG